MIWEAASLLLFFITLPGSFELAFLTMGAFWPAAKTAPLPPLFLQPMQVVVVVPAHNEEKGIVRTLRSLKACPDPFTLVVIADNCSDHTGEIASYYGARVLERNESSRMGKQFALDFAFKKLLQEKFDIFLVIDADTIVGPNLIEEVVSLFKPNVHAVQVKYALKHPYQSYRNRFLNIAFTAFNYLRPRGRQWWNCSAGILGNGFALSRQILSSVPFTVQSIVEDVAYHIELVKAGYCVQFTEKTAVYAEIPSSEAAFTTQRSRWGKGRIHLFFSQFASTVYSIAKGNYRLLEPLLDLMLFPLGYHVCLLFLLLIIAPYNFMKLFAIIGLLIVAIHTLTAVWLSRGGWKDYLALLYAPLYLLQKIKILGKIFRSAHNEEWTRTPRDR